MTRPGTRWAWAGLAALGAMWLTRLCFGAVHPAGHAPGAILTLMLVAPVVCGGVGGLVLSLILRTATARARAVGAVGAAAGFCGLLVLEGLHAGALSWLSLFVLTALGALALAPSWGIMARTGRERA